MFGLLVGQPAALLLHGNAHGQVQPVRDIRGREPIDAALQLLGRGRRRAQLGERLVGEAPFREDAAGLGLGPLDQALELSHGSSFREQPSAAGCRSSAGPMLREPQP
jgi:hypothetical protein